MKALTEFTLSLLSVLLGMSFYKGKNLQERLGEEATLDIVFLLTALHPVIPGKAECTAVNVRVQSDVQPCHCTIIFMVN